MSRDSTGSRRDVLRATGGLAGVGALGMLAGCTDGGDDGDGDDGGTPTETDSGDVEAVSIGGTEEPGNETETAETAASRRMEAGENE